MNKQSRAIQRLVNDNRVKDQIIARLELEAESKTNTITDLIAEIERKDAALEMERDTIETQRKRIAGLVEENEALAFDLSVHTGEYE